ncbi:hypothetical protein MMC07_001430 [Pseudocyphellaria aurata]|nr:hypothetical protein [Pseudocyphellaria aurata]
MVEDASQSSVTMMGTASKFPATYYLLASIFLLVCFDVLYYLHSTASAPSKLKFLSLRHRSSTLQFSILGLALAITLHKSVNNLIVHFESLFGCARVIFDCLAQSVPVIGFLLLSIWIVILTIPPVLKWYPAVRRMLRSGPDAPAEKHVPFASWSYEERLVLYTLESRRRRQQQPQQRSNKADQSDIEKGDAPPTNKSDLHDAVKPRQVLRENVESRSMCALVGLNSLWFLLTAIEWYMASTTGEDFPPTFINIQVVHFSFLSLYGWLDCLITWGEALVEARRARIYV